MEGPPWLQLCRKFQEGSLLMAAALTSTHASLCRVGWGIGRMTAGTVVITGGILAAVILLSIIAVLCYCRLQVSSGPWPGATSKPLPIMGADPGAHFRVTRPRAVGCGKYKSRGLGVGGQSEGSTQRAHCAMSPRAGGLRVRSGGKGAIWGGL